MLKSDAYYNDVIVEVACIVIGCRWHFSRLKGHEDEKACSLKHISIDEEGKCIYREPPSTHIMNMKGGDA